MHNTLLMLLKPCYDRIVQQVMDNYLLGQSTASCSITITLWETAKFFSLSFFPKSLRDPLRPTAGWDERLGDIVASSWSEATWVLRVHLLGGKDKRQHARTPSSYNGQEGRCSHCHFWALYWFFCRTCCLVQPSIRPLGGAVDCWQNGLTREP